MPEIMNREAFGVLRTKLTFEHRNPPSVHHDPWVNLDILWIRNLSLYTPKHAKINTAVAYDQMEAMDFDSSRYSTIDAKIPPLSLARSVFRQTYSVRDQKVNNEMIGLNDEPEDGKTERRK
ncbi:hypothetical protein L596_023886 [Steinernema carpocapsae]|nr:hypothetical protein L596_023886 [Steinernema carpocapsae]